MTGRILIVDDDEGLRDSLQLVLAAEGYHVITAADGSQALAQLEAEAVDVVLCDLRMPGMDGLELLPQLAARQPGVTIILMSAYGSEELAIEALQRGAHDYLAKPFQPAEALFTIRKAQERERLHRANELLQQVIINHPGTPWAARAQKELKRGYGVELVPVYYPPIPKRTGTLIPVPKL